MDTVTPSTMCAGSNKWGDAQKTRECDVKQNIATGIKILAAETGASPRFCKNIGVPFCEVQKQMYLRRFESRSGSHRYAVANVKSHYTCMANIESGTKIPGWSRYHFSAAIPMTITTAPTNTTIEIPAYRMPSINATAIMVFLLPKTVSS